MTSRPDLSGGPVLLSLSLATATFAFATTFVRFFIRMSSHKSKGLGADDYASLIAAIVALIGTIFGIIESTSSDPAKALEFDVLGQPWYLMSVTLSKISICLLFMGLLGTARQWRVLLGVLILSMAAVNFSFALTVNLQCRPLEKVWKPMVMGECWNPSVQRDFGYFQGAFSVFTWFFLAFLPALIVRYLPRDGNPTWPFHMTFALSFASGIFAIVRTAETSRISNNSVYSLNHSRVSLMANLEQNLGLISANILTFGPLFSQFLSTFFSFSQNYRRDPYSSYSSQNSRKSKRAKQPSRTGSSASLTRSGSTSAPSERTGGSKRSSRIIILQRHSGHDHDDPIDYLSDHSDNEEDVDLEAWPRGIIKTVSVEVVEEINPDHVPEQSTTGVGTIGVTKPARGSIIVIPPNAHIKRSGSEREAGNRNRGVGVGSNGEMGWEQILRAGPPH